ncbi:hypothetical protein WR25_25281 isoform B [Diploscapter pachys]|nr:hypothetical protein WR25_25281 isoform B [Diploscapter pachys]
MDFQQLLKQADKQAKKESKKLVEKLSAEEKLKELERQKLIIQEKIAKEQTRAKLKLEAIERKKQEELEQRKSFKIPKKDDDGGAVDKAKIQAFLARKEKEKKEDEKRKIAEKEKLAQLRLQANNGKATKKIGKHFGLDAIDMQMRYGKDHQHIEILQKRKWREEEEQEALAAQYRNGVIKAVQHLKKVEEKKPELSASSSRPKTQSFKSFDYDKPSSSHRSEKIGKSEKRKSTSHPEPGKERDKGKDRTKEKLKHRPPPAAPLDFQSLMNQAKVLNSEKKGKTEDNSDYESDAYEPKEKRRKEEEGRFGDDQRKKKLEEGQRYKIPSSSYSNGHSASKDKERENFAKPQTPVKFEKSKPSLPVKSKKEQERPREPSPVQSSGPVKRYLPGDIRYKAAVEEAKRSGERIPEAAIGPKKRNSVDSPRDDRRSNNNSMDRKQKANQDELYRRQLEAERRREAEMMSRFGGSSTKDKMKQRERERDRDRDRDRDRERNRDRGRERDYRNSSRYSRDLDDDEMDEDEDYDSDLDGFIDDSEMLDDFNQQDFEETLRMVNPKYNTTKWKERERSIRDRDMVADYRSIQKEEARSARLGLKEDIREAIKGKKQIYENGYCDIATDFSQLVRNCSAAAGTEGFNGKTMQQFSGGVSKTDHNNNETNPTTSPSKTAKLTILVQNNNNDKDLATAKEPDPIAFVTGQSGMKTAKQLIYCEGSLLHAVQTAKLFADCKHFVDMPLKSNAEDTLSKWRALETAGPLDAGQIAQFVKDHFDEPEGELVQCEPIDWIPELTFDNIKDAEYRHLTHRLHLKWPSLYRRVSDRVLLNPERFSIIPVPNPFVVPGGRFREMYYWDSFFTIKGLIASKMMKTVQGMIENMQYLAEMYGFIPNGNRLYYLNRSQPPLLTWCVYEYYKATHDLEFVAKLLPTLRKELAFFQANRSIMLDGWIGPLFRFAVTTVTPRPESYR